MGKVLHSLGSNGIGYFSIQSFPYNSFKVIGRRNLFLQTRSKKKLFRNKMTFQTTARENW